MGSEVVGAAQIEAGQIDEAIRLLEEALELGAGKGGSKLAANLCVAHALNMDYSEALHYCSEAAADPDAGPAAFNNRGVVRAVTGDNLGAFRDLRRASCALECQPSCLDDGDTAPAVALRNLNRLKRSFTPPESDFIRFEMNL